MGPSPSGKLSKIASLSQVPNFAPRGVSPTKSYQKSKNHSVEL